MRYRLFIPLHHAMIDRRVDFHGAHDGVVTITADLMPHVKEWCRDNLSGPISRDVFHRSAQRDALATSATNYIEAVGVDALELRFASAKDLEKFSASMKFHG